jgi:hypothetical protein
MRKVNKILMATISILLCLVLISTSVVSGIFAKYVVTKKGQSIVSLEAFGVTLSVSHRTELPDGVTVNTTKNYAQNTVSVEVSNISLAPGESIDDVVIFQVDGTPNVPMVDFKIDVDVGLTNCLVGEKANLPGIAGGKYYMPIGFTAKNAANATSVEVLPPWRVVGGGTDHANAIGQGIRSKFSALAFSGDQDQITSRIWNTSLTSNALKITYFSFGFKCYLDGAPNAPAGQDPQNEAEAHRIQTYLQAAGAAITVTYTVTLQQGF